MLLPQPAMTRAQTQKAPELPSPTGGDESDGRVESPVTEVRYEAARARYELMAFSHPSHTSTFFSHLATF